jgi:hypothetical protein
MTKKLIKCLLNNRTTHNMYSEQIFPRRAESTDNVDRSSKYPFTKIQIELDFHRPNSLTDLLVIDFLVVEDSTVDERLDSC